MKKITVFLICLIIILTTIVAGFAEDLLTIDEALLFPKYKNTKVEIKLDLSGYNPENPSNDDYGDLKIIILEREMPEKQFTERTYDYDDIPYTDGFPDSFRGIDEGTERVWYRGDLMNLLPESNRAETFDDADLLLIAENYYIWSGTVCVMNYENSGGSEMPEFDSLEDMAEYLSTHQRKISSISYYPKFGVYSLVDIYNRWTKDVGIYESKYTEARRFARNPQADSQWNDMQKLKKLLIGVMADNLEDDEITDRLDDMPFIDEDTQEEWRSNIRYGDYEELLNSLEEYYWIMAMDLRWMDPSEENRKNYDLIIANKAYDMLDLFEGLCDYSGFDESVDSIGKTKSYMATWDPEWTEEAVIEFIELLQ